MTIFADSFDRANGALGSNWVTVSGVPGITNNAVSWSGTGQAYTNQLSDQHYQDVSANFTWTTQSFAGHGVVVCMGNDGTGGFAAWTAPDGSNRRIYLRSGGYGGSTALGDYLMPLPIPPMYNIRLTWADGHLVVYYNGSPVITVDSGLNMGSPNMGIGGYAAWGTILDFRGVTGTALSLSANPSVIGNYGTCTAVTLTGAGTAWTPGTPGSPTFTVDHGHISSQTVASATSATVTVCPDNYLGPITITDPSTGMTTAIVATSNPGTVAPPGAGDTWSPYATLVAHTGTYGEPSTLVTDTSTVIGAANNFPALTYIEAIKEIWYAHYATWAGPETPPTSAISYELRKILNGDTDIGSGPWDASYGEPLGATLKKVLEAFGDLRTVNGWTLGSVITELAGTGVPTIADVLTAISGLSAPDLSTVLDAISAVQGPGAVTLAVLAASLADLQGVSGYDLDAIMAAITAISSPDLSSITTKLGQIQPSTDYNLSSLGGSLVTVATALDLISPEIAAILELVTAISEAQGSPASGGLTSSDQLTLLDPIEFSAPFIGSVECDGLIYTISTHGAGVRAYNVGDRTVMTGAGACSFFLDNDRPEPFQQINFDQGIIVPRAIAHAAGFVWSSNVALSGIVTPFTIAAPE